MTLAKPVCLLLLLALLGCAGVELTPISPLQADGLHKGDAKAAGYVVYEPMVVVEISRKEVCLKKNEKGECVEMTAQFSAGAPFVLPDYRKPCLLNLKSGLGKAGADVTIADGWRLGNVKDSSDNTAFLGTVEKLIGAFAASSRAQTSPPSDPGGSLITPGLYRVDRLKDDGIQLVPLRLYVER